MNWEKKQIILPDGETVAAQAPVVISASRATDIPAFYADWLVNRIQVGYVKWINPFNGVSLYVSFDNARLIVFWSKNPVPLLKHLDFLMNGFPIIISSLPSMIMKKSDWNPVCRLLRNGWRLLSGCRNGWERKR